MSLDKGHSAAYARLPPEQRLGVFILTDFLGFDPSKCLFLYPEHLKLLYDRFIAANPKGVVEILDDQEYYYAPPGLSDEQIDRLQEERKIFVDLFLTDSELGYPFARNYLPELFEPDTIQRMTHDPWLDALLLRKAKDGGAVPDDDWATARWSPEWRAYCDRLIAEGREM